MNGSCLCGGVGFAIDGEGAPIEFCHCSRCRKASGSAFAASFCVAASRFRWTRGEELLASFDAPVRTNPPAYRHVFCRACGSSRHIFVRGKAPWFEITDGLTQFDDRGGRP
jgi:hypothetical protein